MEGRGRKGGKELGGPRPLSRRPQQALTDNNDNGRSDGIRERFFCSFSMLCILVMLD